MVDGGAAPSKEIDDHEQGPCPSCPANGVCPSCGWRRRWSGPPPSNARCPHPDCLTAGPLACDEFVLSLARESRAAIPPPSAAAVSNVYEVMEVAGRVYAFRVPRELDGVARNIDGVATGRGRGMSHTEALVFAAWLVRSVPAGRSRLDDILAAIEGLR